MLLVKNGYIKTMDGQDVRCGSVLIGDDDKIIAVGKDIEVPEGNVEVIDADGVEEPTLPITLDGYSMYFYAD